MHLTLFYMNTGKFFIKGSGHLLFCYRKRQAEEEARLQMELEEAERKEEEARRRMEDERKLQMKKDELMKKAVELKAQEEAEKLRVIITSILIWLNLFNFNVVAIKGCKKRIKHIFVKVIR